MTLNAPTTTDILQSLTINGNISSFITYDKDVTYLGVNED